MCFSLNCLLLGEKSRNCFSVIIGAAIVVSNNNINHENIQISHIKSLVFDEISDKLKSLNINNSASLELWKVDGKKVENNENKLEGFSTKDDIKNDLGGEYMEPKHFLSRYFTEDNFKTEIIDKEAIHIIVQVPASTEPISIDELMEKILKNVTTKSSDKTPGFSSSIPLKERNMESAIKSISNNFEQSFYTEESVAKSTLEILVCCGAPGIGKTRYGVELFNHLKKIPEDILKDPSSQPVPDPNFLSIYLDFGRSVELDNRDNNLTADSVIALRIAFKFFVADSYQMEFKEFRNKIYDHFNANGTVESLVKLESIINIGNVIRSIRKFRQLKENQTLFIFLHIDEIQIVFEYEKYWTRDSSEEGTKGFTKRLLKVLGSYLKNKETFIQTFLSGTALQEVIKLKEPTHYSFNFINCPLLSMDACIEIVNYFAVKQNDVNYQWTLDRSFIKILDDARGLPRAIEYILDGILKIDFFKNRIWNPSDFFVVIADRLDKSYAITAFVKNYENLALALLINCMKNNPIERTEKVLKDNINSLTYGELERDQHVILEDDNGVLSIAIPVYFIYIYNKILKLADSILSDTLKPNPDRKLEWQHWESFVTHFEMFKINLLKASGKTTAKLNEIYPGALGNDKTLSLEFKLRNLRGIASLTHQFLITYEDLYCQDTTKSYTWKEAIVFKNAASAEFGDSFVRYVSADDDYADDDDSGYLFCLQYKWIWGKEFQSPIHLNEIIYEHKKNLATLERCDSETIRKQRIITILFTTKAIDPDLPYSFRSIIPDDVLVVCRDNFHQHFGKLFASRYDFELLSVNANYTSPDTLKGILGTAIKDSPQDLQLKRPFRSPKDFKDRVAFKDGVTFESDEKHGINAKICRFSYVPFQKRKVAQTQELPEFNRRVSPRLSKQANKKNYYNLE